jgi:glycosyltransferase involved in cell wall biosynthesis
MGVPSVAVITRTKDRTMLLDRALKSIGAQTHQDYVVVIVNDSGKAAVENIIKKQTDQLRQKIKVINNPKNLGVGGALNTGIKGSESKYIAVLDDDDTWDKDFLKETVGFLEDNNKKFKGVITASELIMEEVKDNHVKEISRQRLTPFTKDFNLFYISGANQFTINTFVYERDVLKKIGYYDEKLEVLEDWDFNIRFISSYDIGFIDKVLAYYHKRGDGQTGSLRNTLYGTHLDYTKALLNESLRKDIKNSQLPTGLIANLSYSNNVLMSHIYKQHDDIYKLGRQLDDITYYTKSVHDRLAELEDKISRIDANIHQSVEYRARRFVRNRIKSRNNKSG